MITAYKAFRDAPEIRRAEPSAAGTLPSSALQYCEAVRTASSFGWYVYPPKDISLLFDGRETHIHEQGHWIPLKGYNLDDEMRENWDRHCPPELAEHDPPYISQNFGPGFVQIWSGYFVETRPGYLLHIRPLANIFTRSGFSVFEGLVHTDTYKPCPLFVNLKLEATDREIYLSKDWPLFQIQILPIGLVDKGEMYKDADLDRDISDPDFDWPGVNGILRKVAERGTRQPGTYGAGVRRSRKNGG